MIPDLCTYNNTLPYLQSIVAAMDQNGSQVPVMIEGQAGNGVELVLATDSPEAISTSQDMYEYYWNQAIPVERWELFIRKQRR